MRSAARILVIAVRLVVGLTCLLLLLASVAANIAGLRAARVDGGSMRPTYHYGDVLIERHPTGHDLALHRIVTLRASNGMIYTHRVVKISGDTVTTKGDANRTTDADTVTQANVIGVPVRHLSGAMAKVYLASEKPSGRVALVIFMALAVLIPAPRRRRATTEDSSTDEGDEQLSDDDTRDREPALA